MKSRAVGSADPPQHPARPKRTHVPLKFNVFKILMSKFFEIKTLRLYPLGKGNRIKTLPKKSGGVGEGALCNCELPVLGSVL